MSLALDLVPNSPEEWTMVATVGLVVVAYSQVRAARAEARKASRAHVVVSSEADRKTRALYVVVTNAGRTLATDISIEWDEVVETANRNATDFSDPAILNPPLLLPGESFRTVFDLAYDREEAKLPMTLKVSVSWLSPATDDEKRFAERYTVDFTRFFATRAWFHVDQEPKQQLRSLDKIAAAIAELTEATRSAVESDQRPAYSPPIDPETSDDGEGPSGTE